MGKGGGKAHLKQLSPEKHGATARNLQGIHRKNRPARNNRRVWPEESKVRKKKGKASQKHPSSQIHTHPVRGKIAMTNGETGPGTHEKLSRGV